MNNKKIAQTTIIITFVILLSKLTGFLRDVALAYAFGTSVASDAFVLSHSVIGIFTSLLFVGIEISFIPVFINIQIYGESQELQDFIDSTYSVASILILIAGGLGFLGADVFVYLLSPGFSQEAHNLTVNLTRILLPTVFFTFISTIQSQHLRGNHIFILPACMAFPSNILLIIAFIFLTPYFGIGVAAFSFSLGTLLQIFMLYLPIRRLNYHFHFHFDLYNSGLHKILILTLPIMLGNAIMAINTIINLILASGLEEGSIAALNFSNKLSLFFVGLVSFGAGTVCYTKMSEMGARKEYDELKAFLRNIINFLNLFIVPATIGMMVLNVPVIKFIFEYGAFDSNSSEMTATTLWYYSIGLVGFVIRDIITRVFYALNDAKTPMINGGIAVGIGIIANLILVRTMGVGGLALASSISGIVGTILLFVSLRKKLGRIGLKEMGSTFIKTCAAGSIMGITIHYLYPVLFNITGLLPVAFLFDIFIGMIIYSTLILFMRINEVHFLIKYLMRFLKSSDPN